MQFASGWVVPLFFASLYLSWRDRRPWLLTLAAWTFCGAFYTSAYVAYFLLMTSGMSAALIVLQQPRDAPEAALALAERLRSWPGRQIALWIGATALPFLLLGAGAYGYRLAARDVGMGSLGDMLTYQASIWSWIRPDGANLVWRAFATALPADPVAPWEKQFFLGWIALACMLVPLVPGIPLRQDGPVPPRVLRAAAGAVLLSIVLVSHFPVAALNAPFHLAFRFLPGFSALRASGRIALVVAAMSSLVAAVMVEEMRQVRPIAAGIVAALLMLEAVTPIPPVADRCEGDRPWQSLQPRLCELAHSADAGTLLFLPMDEISFDRIFAQVPEMTLALECGVATINGYTGREASSVVPLLHGDSGRLNCAAARDAIQAAANASRKGTLVYVEESGPLGAPGYPLQQVTDCFAGCIAQTAPIRVEGRRGTAISLAAHCPAR